MATLMQHCKNHPATPTRRAVLRLGGAWTLAAMAGCVITKPREQPRLIPPPDRTHHNNLPTLFPAPDLRDEMILSYDAGIRPFRRGGVRLAVEPRPDSSQTWVHNYGHGGAGWTLSWGCAAWVADRVRELDAPKNIAVLGAGVVGMTTALTLAEQGCRVTLFAEHVGIGTTSAKAGAQFSPSFVSLKQNKNPQALMTQLLRTGHARFSNELRHNTGVLARTNFTAGRAGHALTQLPQDLSQPQTHDRLPIQGLDVPGNSYETLLIEPPRYLSALQKKLASHGVRFQTQRFTHPDEIANLPQPVVVNCLGLGAGKLLNDDNVIPVKGQLVHLQPQPLGYMISHRGYMFPRSDALVLGGTLERGVTDPTPDKATCQNILTRHRNFFSTAPTRAQRASTT